MSRRREQLARQADQMPPELWSEDHFEAWCEVRAAEAGWRLQFHVRRAQVKGRWITNTSSPGVPDRWFLRPPRLVVLECKTVKGAATPEQREWIAGLQQVPGVEAYIVDPRDTDEIRHLFA